MTYTTNNFGVNNDLITLNNHPFVDGDKLVVTASEQAGNKLKLGSSIQTITVNNGGSGYTSPPNVIVTDNGSGPATPGSFSATINNSGVVTAITVIDGDVVLRATSTGDVQISADDTNWSQSIGAQLVQGDTLYTRILNGPNYTQKRTGTLNVFAVGGDTYTRGSNSYENTTSGTYGSGGYQVTQNLDKRTMTSRVLLL